eukprot:11629051-Alexandrium_andersonii.AAC.1
MQEASVYLNLLEGRTVARQDSDLQEDVGVDGPVVEGRPGVPRRRVDRAFRLSQSFRWGKIAFKYKGSRIPGKGSYQ